MSLPGRRLITVLTLTAAAAASGALALPGQAAARAGRPACSSALAHRARRARACSRSRRHSVRHATRKVKGKARHAAKHKTTAAEQVKAGCEDGSTPQRTGPDSFVCDDSSEPSCESGSYPIVSASGTTLLCSVPAKTGSGSSASPAQNEPEEPICEDGSAPYASGSWFACDDGSEPFCEQGAYLTVSSDGSTLECLAEEAEE